MMPWTVLHEGAKMVSVLQNLPMISKPKMTAMKEEMGSGKFGLLWQMRYPRGGDNIHSPWTDGAMEQKLGTGFGDVNWRMCPDDAIRQPISWSSLT
ncbi:hypothetical protein Nepgr_009968 [Nepenthes gracilis]|uniref:Uncharacterized protein n=1 Tax=Nepenthes gracilis TaxID=150966 RepID=A0AAD3XKM2_NEPGR|nr:hypothetical protein Nepgr_009968 [Nepenthes gracilis]